MTFTSAYDLVERLVGPLFTRPEPHATFANLVRGLMADVPRQLADHVGHKNAYRFEWPLNGAKPAPTGSAPP